MSSDFFVVVGTGLVTACASLGGVWITQKHQERLAREQHRSIERERVRDIVTAIVEAGESWVRNGELVVPVLWKAQIADVDVILDTNLLRQFSESSAALSSALNGALLRIGDRDLQSALVEVYRQFRDFPEAAMTKVFPSRKRDTSSDEPLFEAFRAVWSLRNAIEELQAKSLPYLTTTIADAPRKRWARWAWRDLRVAGGRRA